MLRNPTPSYMKYYPVSHFNLTFFPQVTDHQIVLYCYIRLFIHQIKFLKKAKKPSTVVICTDKIQITSLFPTQKAMRYHKINKRTRF